MGLANRWFHPRLCLLVSLITSPHFFYRAFLVLGNVKLAAEYAIAPGSMLYKSPSRPEISSKTNRFDILLIFNGKFFFDDLQAAYYKSRRRNELVQGFYRGPVEGIQR